MSEPDYIKVRSRKQRRKDRKRAARQQRAAQCTGVRAVLAEWLVKALKKVHKERSTLWDELTPTGALKRSLGQALPAEKFESPYAARPQRKRQQGDNNTAAKRAQKKTKAPRVRRSMSTLDVHRLLAWMSAGSAHMASADVYGVQPIMKAYGAESMCPQGVCLPFSGLLRWVRAEALRNPATVRQWMAKLGFRTQQPLLELKTYNGARRHSHLVVSQNIAAPTVVAEPTVVVSEPAASAVPAVQRTAQGAWARGRPAAFDSDADAANTENKQDCKEDVAAVDAKANAESQDSVNAESQAVEYASAQQVFDSLYSKPAKLSPRRWVEEVPQEDTDKQSASSDEEEAAWAAVDPADKAADKEASPEQTEQLEMQMQHSPNGAWTIRLKGVPAQMGAALQAVLAQAMQAAPAH